MSERILLYGPDAFARDANVSRETLALLKAYVGLLEEWNARHNLVAASTLPDLWRRHMWDSAQLAARIPAEARSLVDLGSGAGFPGLVLATIVRERPGFRTVLYESTGKKAAFLQAAAERMNVPVEIRNGRIEAAKREAFDVVSARALAPLPKLLPYAQLFAGPDTVCLFLKGQNIGVELTEARKSWKMSVLSHPSQSDPSGTVLEIRELRRV